VAGKKPLRLKGYRALGGSSRKYETPRGKIISRREYDNRRLRKQGWKNRSEAERFRTGPIYTQKRSKLEAAGRKPKELDIFSDFAEFVRDIDWDKVNELWDEVEQERESGEARFDPNGPLAEVLAMEGARLPDWEWAVGDTPSGERGVV
jgi:hypothetical protein